VYAAETVGSRHRLLARAVLDELRAAIIAGDYQPGQRLVEEEIAAHLDVSRNPIREALRVLSSEGFVELEPRRGARVAVIDERRAAELFELRGPLEGLVARLAARRATAADVAALRGVISAADDAIAVGRLELLPALNSEFHGCLASAAANELLAGTLARLSDIIRWLYAARIAGRAERSWREHAEIVDAVAAHDEDAAERLGRSHIVAASAAYNLAAVEVPARS
jgi:DNA-binding GntR family transcriptional regulator